jgi:transcriptional regulator with XRE-family HTH domain
MVSLTIGICKMKDLTITDDIMLNIYKNIGNNVKQIRKSKNISQLALSLAIGHKAVGTVSMAELCINKKHFNIEHLAKIADVLEVDICEFFKE